jgi:hypothetical protein
VGGGPLVTDGFRFVEVICMGLVAINGRLN